ncbi:MAG: hypothetical protein FWE31_03800 [Firmicutes bacterium]|nr:hypothetical protein [Bacillota bacterium]
MKKLLAALVGMAMLIAIPVALVGCRGGDDDKDTAQPVFYFYTTFGTLPTLYASLHMLTHTHPTFKFYGRQDTFYEGALPGHVEFMTEITRPGQGNYMLSSAQSMRQRVADLDAKHENAMFRFFVDDLRVLMPFYAALRAGIPMERFHVTVLTDGTATYGPLFDQQYVDGLGHDAAARWAQHYNSFHNVRLPHFANQEAAPGGVYPYVGWSHYAYVAAQLPNVEFWMQFPEYRFLVNTNSTVQRELMTATLVKRQPADILNTLTLENRELFFEGVLNNPNFNLGENQDQPLRPILNSIFAEAEKADRPIMIISGSNPNHSLSELVDQVFAEFGANGVNYTFMWKPHPARTHEDAYMAGRGITVLPARIPMEVLLWAFPDVYIGGYQSSLYMAATTQVRFFMYPAGVTVLPGILQIIYDAGMFPNVAGNHFFA